MRNDELADKKIPSGTKTNTELFLDRQTFDTDVLTSQMCEASEFGSVLFLYFFNIRY